MNKAYLLLGSNEGNREEWLERCLDMLSEHGNITALSAIYETEAWGLAEQPDFLNTAVCLETELDPTQLLAEIQQIEAALERQRTVKWGQRTLDIDIIFYNDDVIDQPDLVVPHPYLQDRGFALIPICELVPDYIHPVLQKSVTTLLEECADTLPVRMYVPGGK